MAQEDKMSKQRKEKHSSIGGNMAKVKEKVQSNSDLD